MGHTRRDRLDLNFGTIISILFFVSFVLPPITRWLLEYRRYSVLRAIEKKRGSRVVSLIHRQESISFLGIPLARYIDI